MDSDFLKTISHEEHMEMVSMMMEINHLYGPHNYADGQTSSSDFSGQTNESSAQHNLTKTFLNIADNPAFANLPANISFSGEAEGMQYSPDSGARKHNSMAAMREMIFRMAAMQPVHIDPESVKAPKRRNVKISKDPQSVAARHRRERISERIRILQRLVPGGTKMDTASMLDEAIHYVKFLKTQVQSLERAAAIRPPPEGIVGFPVAAVGGSLVPHWVKGYHLPSENVEQYSDA